MASSHQSSSVTLSMPALLNQEAMRSGTYLQAAHPAVSCSCCWGYSRSAHKDQAALLRQGGSRVALTGDDVRRHDPIWSTSSVWMSCCLCATCWSDCSPSSHISDCQTCQQLLPSTEAERGKEGERVLGLGYQASSELNLWLSWRTEAEHRWS